jgi:hypothetical protein
MRDLGDLPLSPMEMDENEKSLRSKRKQWIFKYNQNIKKLVAFECPWR